MCDNCFTTEIRKFKDQKQWTTFDLELSQKLGQEKLKQIRVVSKIRQGDEEELYVYQCVTCGQKWKLEEPHDHGDGHFIKLSTFENLVTRQLSNRQLAFLALIVVVVFIIVRAIFW
jgi:hypothetical protein